RLTPRADRRGGLHARCGLPALRLSSAGGARGRVGGSRPECAVGTRRGNVPLPSVSCSPDDAPTPLGTFFRRVASAGRLLPEGGGGRSPSSRGCRQPVAFCRGWHEPVALPVRTLRSEERRVGKEGRVRVSTSVV